MMTEQTEEQDVTSESSRGAFLISLLAKRKEYITGRAGSGIEDDWTEDEEHYQGIDAANRAYVTAGGTAAAKKWATGSAVEEKQATRSVVFLNITAPYVDAASARVADMLLPTDDRCWALKPTPIPRLSQAMMTLMGGPENAKAAVEQSQELAKEAAALMQDEIDDCLNESNWHGEVRQVIEDSARIGSGVVKGPFPIKRTARMYQNVKGVQQLLQVTEIKPGSKRIDAWNFFPDPACGESIHNGGGCWEREHISAKQLREMVDMKGYNKEAILAALKEGPCKTQSDGAISQAVKSDEQFELWIFYGSCDADDLGAVGIEVEDETPKASVMAVVINDRLVKCALNVLDTGDLPYDILAWQRRPGSPWGAGVGRKIRTPQRMLNGGARIMMDNAGLSGGVQIVIGNGITPADGNYTITGKKIWRADTDTMDVRAAFSSFVPPSVQAEMMGIINFALKMAEDTAGMPAMLQGIRGDAPDTLGGMQLQDTRASGVLRRLAKRFDDYVTEPHIRRYYDWMMQHSEREDIKGDFQIDVRASSALVERDAQQQFLVTLLQASANPVYELDPAKLAAELLKGQRYDPKRIQYSKEKLAQMQNTAQPVTAIDEAKTKLLEAQALKTQAETTTKNVEGMFSATSAANQIALMPSIAPLADSMLMSAGFKDANAAPGIPSVPAGVQPVAGLPENTSPNFPPNPQAPPNPDVGMDAGIETGPELDGDQESD